MRRRKGAIDDVTGAPGNIAKGAAAGALNQLTKWMTDAATWTTKQIATGIQKTSTPELKSSWYKERFSSMAALGMGLAALVAMMALASAALRRDPRRWVRRSTACSGPGSGQAWCWY